MNKEIQHIISATNIFAWNNKMINDTLNIFGLLPVPFCSSDEAFRGIHIRLFGANDGVIEDSLNALS